MRKCDRNTQRNNVWFLPGTATCANYFIPSCYYRLRNMGYVWTLMDLVHQEIEILFVSILYCQYSFGVRLLFYDNFLSFLDNDLNTSTLYTRENALGQERHWRKHPKTFWHIGQKYIQMKLSPWVHNYTNHKKVFSTKTSACRDGTLKKQPN